MSCVGNNDDSDDGGGHDDDRAADWRADFWHIAWPPLQGKFFVELRNKAGLLATSFFLACLRLLLYVVRLSLAVFFYRMPVQKS